MPLVTKRRSRRPKAWVLISVPWTYSSTQTVRNMCWRSIRLLLFPRSVLTNTCVRCGHFWKIGAIDAWGAYYKRLEANVCWECEDEGW